VCTEHGEEHLPSSPGIWREKWISDFEDQRFIAQLGLCSRTASGNWWCLTARFHYHTVKAVS